MFGKKTKRPHRLAAMTGLIALNVATLAMAQGARTPAQEPRSAGQTSARTHEERLLRDAKIPLTQAITTAVQAGGGTPVAAHYDNENGRLQAEVTLAANDGTEQVAKIDAMNGKVISLEPDDNERHAGNRADDDDREADDDREQESEHAG